MLHTRTESAGNSVRRPRRGRTSGRHPPGSPGATPCRDVHRWPARRRCRRHPRRWRRRPVPGRRMPPARWHATPDRRHVRPRALTGRTRNFRCRARNGSATIPVSVSRAASSSAGAAGRRDAST
jgi:hypothetical protein